MPSENAPDTSYVLALLKQLVADIHHASEGDRSLLPADIVQQADALHLKFQEADRAT